jgi:Cft2 family RNA processing exonuclease
MDEEPPFYQAVVCQCDISSGMATGGRVLYHIKAFGSDPRNTILFTGYVAGGMRGAAMIHGMDSIKIHGEYVKLRAQAAQIDNLSAHGAEADLHRPRRTGRRRHHGDAGTDPSRHRGTRHAVRRHAAGRGRAYAESQEDFVVLQEHA